MPVLSRRLALPFYTGVRVEHSLHKFIGLSLSHRTIFSIDNDQCLIWVEICLILLSWHVFIREHFRMLLSVCKMQVAEKIHFLVSVSPF